jgi:hypothetical protein
VTYLKTILKVPANAFSGKSLTEFSKARRAKVREKYWLIKAMIK